MRKTFLLPLLLGVLLLSACASPTAAPTPAPANTEIPTSAPTEAATEEHNDAEMAPAPTDAAAQPTGESAPVAGADGKVEVQIRMGDNWIKSNLTTFKVGTTYVFNITNTGNRVHNFNISKPADKTTDGVRAALANALLHVDDEQLGPGANVKVEFTFTEPAPAGSLEFACLIERHYKSGQFLALVVEP
jgi:uncharacterized cupredoxin-like copper-binding protein